MYPSRKLPSVLITAASLSGGLGAVLSVSSMLMSVLAIKFRYHCAMTTMHPDGAEFFMHTVVRTFILKESCSYLEDLENITKADSVFVLAIIVLVFSVLNFMMAVSVLIVANQKIPLTNVDVFIYIYLGTSLAMLVVELTVGVHFGMDYVTMNRKMRLNPGGLSMNYKNDMVRLGALFLMTMILKGYIGHFMNIVLLIVLAVYVIRFQRGYYEDLHPIRKLGAINAFESPRLPDGPWNSEPRSDVFMLSRGTSTSVLNNDEELRQRPTTRETVIPLTDISSPLRRSNEPRVQQPHRIETFAGYPRSAESNTSFNNEIVPRVIITNENPSNNPQNRLEEPWVQVPQRIETFAGYQRGAESNPSLSNDTAPRTAITRESSASDRPYDRSHSWLHNSGAAIGSRPFSYLEDPKRPMPMKPPTTPSNEPQWRRDAWPPAPPVPDPDYSPPPRRLKSALKSNYM